jgi:hypothetical protein
LTSEARVTFRTRITGRRIHLGRIDPRSVDSMDEVAVDLTDADDGQMRMEDMPAPPVLGDRVGSVSYPCGQIEGRKRARADAARASTETMDEAGEVPRGHHVQRGAWISNRGDWFGERHQPLLRGS